MSKISKIMMIAATIIMFTFLFMSLAYSCNTVQTVKASGGIVDPTPTPTVLPDFNQYCPIPPYYGQVHTYYFCIAIYAPMVVK